jgi:hypothetical protein
MFVHLLIMIIVIKYILVLKWGLNPFWNLEFGNELENKRGAEGNPYTQWEEKDINKYTIS